MLVLLSTVEATVELHQYLRQVLTMVFSQPTPVQLDSVLGKKDPSTSGILTPTMSTIMVIPSTLILLPVFHIYSTLLSNASSVMMMRLPSSSSLNLFKKNNLVEPCSGNSPEINMEYFSILFTRLLDLDEYEDKIKVISLNIVDIKFIIN